MAPSTDSWTAPSADSWMTRSADSWTAPSIDSWTATSTDSWIARSIDSWSAHGPPLTRGRLPPLTRGRPAPLTRGRPGPSTDSRTALSTDSRWTSPLTLGWPPRQIHSQNCFHEHFQLCSKLLEFRLKPEIFSLKPKEIYYFLTSDLLAQASTRMTANARFDASMPVLVHEPECVPVSIWSENRLSFMSV